jgi:hypothetical protein
MCRAYYKSIHMCVYVGGCRSTTVAAATSVWQSCQSLGTRGSSVLVYMLSSGSNFPTSGSIFPIGDGMSTNSTNAVVAATYLNVCA